MFDKPILRAYLRESYPFAFSRFNLLITNDKYNNKKALTIFGGIICVMKLSHKIIDRNIMD